MEGLGFFLEGVGAALKLFFIGLWSIIKWPLIIIAAILFIVFIIFTLCYDTDSEK